MPMNSTLWAHSSMHPALDLPCGLPMSIVSTLSWYTKNDHRFL